MSWLMNWSSGRLWIFILVGMGIGLTQVQSHGALSVKLLVVSLALPVFLLVRLARRRLEIVLAVVLVVSGLALVGQLHLPGKSPLTVAVSRLLALDPALHRWEQVALPPLGRELSLAADSPVTRHGDFFRLLAPLLVRWQRTADSFPLGVVLRREGRRLAWAGVVEPLPMVAVAAGRQLVRGKLKWILHDMRALAGGYQLEVQVHLAQLDGAGFSPGVVLQPEPTGGDGLRQFGLGPAGEGPFVSLRADRDSNASSGGLLARLMLLNLALWLVAVWVAGRHEMGFGGALVALVVARWWLAANDAMQWVGPAFPDHVFPASPGSWFSLVDPAYFATPLAGGCLASIADALLSAAVVVMVAVYVMRRRRMWSAAGSRLPALVGPGLVGGGVFGFAVGAVLSALVILARVIAENANPRLVGAGVDWSSLGFWGLHIVLLAVAVSLVALAVSLLVGQDGAGRGVGWLVAGPVASLVAAANSIWWPGCLAAGLAAWALWFVGVGWRRRHRFTRRVALPVLLVITVCWNYLALRAVYDPAERHWLESKAARVAAVDTGWSRFLLASVLEGMVTADRDLTADGSGPDLWQDGAAWSLYQQSSLRDLGKDCAVEVLDAEGRQESAFALGFLRTKRFEVLARSTAQDMSGQDLKVSGGTVFGTERRRYSGGEEEVLIAETERIAGRGWLRVELPVRSWRVHTLAAVIGAASTAPVGGYRPRSEVDRERVLLLGDDNGWLDTGVWGIPESSAALAEIRQGQRHWANIQLDGDSWLCLWKPLPDGFARTAGEGVLLGLRRSTWPENLMDLSRLMLLDLALFFGGYLLLQLLRSVVVLGATGQPLWRPGFQDRFLAGYLSLGLVLLVIVGMSVNRESSQSVRDEARDQARAGLIRAVDQLHALLTEQAWSLVESEYLDELMRGRLVGKRPAGADNIRQGMVFAADGELLLDETLSDLSPPAAATLLVAGRSSPLVVMREPGALFIGAVIPIDLGDWIAGTDTTDNGVGHSRVNTNGFFLYRQRLDKDLVGSLAELVGGQVTLDVAGQTLLASHPAAVFAGAVPLLAAADEMITILDHGHGASVFAKRGRRFAFTAGQPLASVTTANGVFTRDPLPAVLSLSFPDREREYAKRRHDTILYLAGLANLVLLTALALALLMSWNIFRPLRVLLAATRSLQRGDFRAPLPDAGNDEVGQLAGAFGAMRAELAEREQFLATVLERVTVGVAVVDSADSVVVLNPAGAGILRAFWPGREADTAVVELMALFRQAQVTSGPQVGEIVSADGRCTVRGALAPLILPGNRLDTMLVFEDITEFLATRKMALSAELTRQVAHEIKNPLTPITLSVQYLQQAWRDQHPELATIVPETVERVLQQVSLLRSIATEFSLLGRSGELACEPLDFSGLVAEVVRAYAPDALAQENRVQIAATALPPVQAHRESLHKVLGNLMQNSLDAVRPGIPLEIEVDWRFDETEVTLVWRDNGVGLPAEMAGRLFDPYFSTKSKGTGLGLVICRNLADRMGGSISLANRVEGPGTVAELTLPRVENGGTTE